jgi:uncharacterized Zn finger protein (UPF0148 family)
MGKSKKDLLKKTAQDDVIELESEPEKEASDVLDSEYIQPALAGNEDAQKFLMDLWGESWEEIKEKLETEGSVWYVWWMDGVHKFMAQTKPDLFKYEESKHSKTSVLKKTAQENIVKKYPDIINFHNIDPEAVLEFGPETEEYKELEKISDEEEWSTYLNDMAASGSTVMYDNVDDVYKVYGFQATVPDWQASKKSTRSVIAQDGWYHCPKCGYTGKENTFIKTESGGFSCPVCHNTDLESATRHIEKEPEESKLDLPGVRTRSSNDLLKKKAQGDPGEGKYEVLWRTVEDYVGTLRFDDLGKALDFAREKVDEDLQGVFINDVSSYPSEDLYGNLKDWDPHDIRQLGSKKTSSSNLIKKSTIQLFKTEDDAWKDIEEIKELMPKTITVNQPIKIKYDESDKSKFGMKGFDFDAVPGQEYFIIGDPKEVGTWGLKSVVIGSRSIANLIKKTAEDKLPWKYIDKAMDELRYGPEYSYESLSDDEQEKVLSKARKIEEFESRTKPKASKKTAQFPEDIGFDSVEIPAEDELKEFVLEYLEAGVDVEDIEDEVSMNERFTNALSTDKINNIIEKMCDQYYEIKESKKISQEEFKPGDEVIEIDTRTKGTVTEGKSYAPDNVYVLFENEKFAVPVHVAKIEKISSKKTAKVSKKDLLGE